MELWPTQRGLSIFQFLSLVRELCVELKATLQRLQRCEIFQRDLNKDFFVRVFCDFLRQRPFWLSGVGEHTDFLNILYQGLGLVHCTWDLQKRNLVNTLLQSDIYIYNIYIYNIYIYNIYIYIFSPLPRDKGVLKGYCADIPHGAQNLGDLGN